MLGTDRKISTNDDEIGFKSRKLMDSIIFPEAATGIFFAAKMSKNAEIEARNLAEKTS